MNAITAHGEVALFRAVINLTINDAMPRARRHGGRLVLTAQRRRDMDVARNWLLGMSRDFRTVCELALFEPLAVKAAAEKSIAAFDQAFTNPIPATGHCARAAMESAGETAACA